MELVAPAGNLEKAAYAYLYGADAVYMGLAGLSLRTYAEENAVEDLQRLAPVKCKKKLYLAANIFFHNLDLELLDKNAPLLESLAFDGFIVSDLGAFRILKSLFPGKEFHLSTQANCVNVEAAKFYRDIGFSRIVPGRELTLEEIGEIAAKVPEIELEVFVHGAMCLAYSGRCFLSSYMTGRSSNRGDCAHSCRWRYMLLEEESRPGEYFPVTEGNGHTTILSSKDLCMIDHLDKLQSAGAGALKIEGRMKSVYYTAVTTRAYRKALDKLAGKPVPNLEAFTAELMNISHREYSTGFYFGRRDADTTTSVSYIQTCRLMGLVREPAGEGVWEIDVRNSFSRGLTVEYLFPHIPVIADNTYVLLDEHMAPVEKARHGMRHFLKTSVNLEPGCIIRARR